MVKIKYTKISGFSDIIADDINEQFRVLNKLGICCFEPRKINGKNISALNDEEVADLKTTMCRYGIKASSVGSPIGKIKLSYNFDEHFELFKRVIKTAKMLECMNIRVFSFYREGDGDWSANERTEVIKRLKKMISYAEQNDVVLLHENEKKTYGDTPERCLDLFNELFCDNFKAVLDLANFVQCGVDTVKAFEMLKPYICYMHVKDAVFSGGKVVPFGTGNGNAEYILTELLKSGFDGYLSLEPHAASIIDLNAPSLKNYVINLPDGKEGIFTLDYILLNEMLERI